VWGEVLSTCRYGGNTYVLASRDDNRIFINGAGLDFDAGFLISNILGDGLQSPSRCISTTGIVSTFYATDDTSLHVKLPYSPASVEWMKRGINGAVSSGNVPYDENEGYEDYLEGGTLLVLKITGNASVGITRPSDALYVNDREIIPLSGTIIIGGITIDADAASNTGIRNVEFYIEHRTNGSGTSMRSAAVKSR